MNLQTPIKHLCILAALFILLTSATPGSSSAPPSEAEQPAASSPKIRIEPITGMELVYVKGGCYPMGCGSWTTECMNDELPVHEVCIDDFWIGKYEVTQGQWQKIMGDNPAYFKDGDNYPVETISWEYSQQFLAALNKMTKKKFRLPTEAEWEYAARSGGQDEKYAGGNNIANFSWCSFNSGERTKAVGGKNPNGLGIYDMSGNVSEWVQDFYQSDYYNNSPKQNPKGPSSGDGRVYRGGCWGNVPGFLRVVARNWHPQDIGVNTIGLRILLPATAK